MSGKFAWRTETDNETGLQYIILMYNNPTFPEKSMEAWIAPAAGSNMCRFRVGACNVIDFDREILVKSGFTGNPVLYPTPNRVKNGEISFEGKSYQQLKKGKTINIHGLVHDEPWQYDNPKADEGSIILKTWIDFDRDSAMFEAFPFVHRLSMKFMLSENGIRTVVIVENKDDKNLPFGFALHPFFMKLSGDDDTLISLPSDYVMDTFDDGYFSTGKRNDVAGTDFDLRKPVNLGRLNFDHDFTGQKDDAPSEIIYRGRPFKIEITASRCFGHIMLFTPQGKDFFCIENQTCSINAHNLYEEGFMSESGLIILKAKGSFSAYVDYTVK